jgi:hypothetical protein
MMRYVIEKLTMEVGPVVGKELTHTPHKNVSSTLAVSVRTFW